MQEKLEQKYKHEISQLIPVSNLSSHFRKKLISQSEVVMIPIGNSLFEQDEKSESLFYLLSGEVEFYSGKDLVKTISAGTESSRIAINQIVSFSVTAKTRVVLLMVKRSFVDRLLILDGSADFLASLDKEESTDWMTPLLSSEFFSQIPSARMPGLFNALDSVILKKGEQVITQNMTGDYFYIIREGYCEVSRKDFVSGETITLTELEVGDYFGEEALLPDQKRNVSVTMLSAGRMMRLARKDYDDLIKQTRSHEVDFTEASSRISHGAIWLDVRLEDEYSQNRLKHSQNIPFAELEQELDQLSSENPYIIYCDTGVRSSVAASLLLEKGFDVSCLKGGLREYSGVGSMSEAWIDGLSDRLRDEEKTTTMSKKEDDFTGVGESVGEQIMQVDRRIRDLKEMFTTENLLAQEWLENSENDQPVEDLGVLIEARKKIDHIESMPISSSPEELSDQEDNDLSLLREQLENAQSHLQQESNRVSREDKDSEQQELTLKHVSDELETIKNRLKAKESFELKRRESFELQLATERKKMREQLARFSTGLERQQSKSLEIEKVRQISALETRQIIEKFKDAHEQYRLRQQKTIDAVRNQLKQQAGHVIEKAKQAQAEKAQAIASLQAVQNQLDMLRKQRIEQFDQGTSEVPLLVDVESMGDEIDQAKEKFYEADSALSKAKSENHQNREMLEKIDSDEKSVRHELVDWFTSNDQFNLDSENLTDEQRASHERVKKIAHEALEEAFSGGHHRPDGSGDDILKNYK